MDKSLKKSLILHLVIILLFAIDLSFWRRDMKISQVPIIVDLQDVKISEMTNLPPKAVKGKEDKDASVKKRKVAESSVKEEAEPEQPKEIKKAVEEKVEPKKAEVVEPDKDFLVAPQPKKPVQKQKIAPKKTVKKPLSKKVKPKKPAPKKEDKKKPTLANPLKSLLASVEDLEKTIKEEKQTATVSEDTNVDHMGVEGGVGGSYFSELSISETDAIAGRLRACWNLDPGAMGIKDMIIEIRAYLNQDGSVKKVDVLDSSRYGSDNHFRSVADSARRAVYICAPYDIFAQKYGDKYDMWKTMLLRFNPLDGQVK